MSSGVGARGDRAARRKWGSVRAVADELHVSYRQAKRLLAEVRRQHLLSRDATIVSGKYLTSDQAASLLGMSRPFLNKLLDEGRIPFHCNGRDRRIELPDVLAYMQQRDRLKQAHVAAAAGYDQRRAARLEELAKSAGQPILLPPYRCAARDLTSTQDDDE